MDVIVLNDRTRGQLAQLVANVNIANRELQQGINVAAAVLDLNLAQYGFDVESLRFVPIADPAEPTA